MYSTFKTAEFETLAHETSSRRSTALTLPLRTARCIILKGHVQGLGVRPAIFRLATELGLGGTVRNTPRGVEIEVEGIATGVAQFERCLPRALPTGATATQILSETALPCDRQEFTIVKELSDGPLVAPVPADRAVCERCLAEVGRPTDRRHNYPFTSCTLCGPRYTVIGSMPFEREDTTMVDFPLCEPCRREYQRPGDRRFHAQTTGCSDCGPSVWFVDLQHTSKRLHSEAIHAAVRALRAGRIVALRGIGGYQLLVDATNNAAVERLRARKGRPAKPLAVLVGTAAEAIRLAHLDADELAAFTDPSAPIVLVRARAANGLAAAIHPNLDTVGLMRPTTPLHAMLAREFGQPLVCTSGNRDGEPLEFEVKSAERYLAGIADAWLHHDRPIARPIDDSVVRIIAGRRVTIRLARGLAPLPLDLPTMPPTLAVGGYLKNAAAWSSGAQAVLGPHIGDHETLASRVRYLAQLEDWQRLYRFRAERFVHDLHPDYYSTRWAQSRRKPMLAVQHHHAHVAAGMLEHHWFDREVLGIAWDGTGFGTDGSVWGGEFLVAASADFERVATLRPFRLLGSEAAINEPWRTAVAISCQLDDPEQSRHWQFPNVSPGQITTARQLVNYPRLSPSTTSAGRLFDAAAALILGIDKVSFDGEAAMRLEAVADRTARGRYAFPLIDSQQPFELDWRPMFTELLADCQHGVDPAIMSMRFHRGLAYGTKAVAERWPCLPVVLTGGIFQNRLLAELVAGLIGAEHQPLGLPGLIPPNDGGLAAGQLAVAAANAEVFQCA
jgi:hydrogenase maturation protein HypF